MAAPTLRLWIVALATGLAVGNASGAVPNYSALVNPLIGTANGGNVFPGAVAPFGMVQFSPEESPDPKHKSPIAAPGGYEHHLNRIRGFSLTNVSGWGCGGGSGDIPLMPVTEPVAASPSSDFRTAYASTFDHKNETARAGRYRVTLDNGVGVDLTASKRTGSARFTFPSKGEANLLIRASDSEVGSSDAHIQIDPAKHMVSGDVTSGNFCGYINKEDRRSYYTLHFVAVFDQPFARQGVWKDKVVKPGGETADGGTGYGPKGWPEAGAGSGGWVGFVPGSVVNVRIGLSYVSQANARANLNAENPSGATLETISAQTQAAWNRRLGQIAVTGGSNDQRTVFYTALYHSLLHPNLFSDVNGEYWGFDGQRHKVQGNQRAQYANFSGWDVYRDQLQLVTWLDPNVGSDIAQSLYNQAKQNHGVWDRWTHESGGVHVMNGDPAAPALADIWAFGGRAFDAKGALASLVAAARTPTAGDLSHNGCEVECVGQRPGLDQWLKLHYIPTGAPQWGGGADTLETVSAEFGLSALAERLGETAVAQEFLRRSGFWRNLFDPNAAPDGGYIRNRNPDGSWALVSDDDDGKTPPHAFAPSTEDGFVEGSAAQYVWMVPFDVEGLFDIMGGRDKARARLDAFFYKPDGAMAVTKAGPLHAELDNEPSIETPWLYDYAGAPWKTQELVRNVINTIWINEPKGIPGNDDLGAMSSWAVFAMLGFYPETPGRAEFVLGSPLFEHAVVHRPGGDLRINAEGAGTNAPYVAALRIDGKASVRPWLSEGFVLRGGRLDFRLASQPNKAWGADPADAPPSFESRP